MNTKDIDSIHRGMRLDLLEKIVYKNRKGFRSTVRKLFRIKRRKFTDYFFSLCENKYAYIDKMIWLEFLNDFSYLNEISSSENTDSDSNSSAKSKTKTIDFVVSENLFTRLVYWLQQKKDYIKNFL